MPAQEWLELDRQFHVALNGRETALSGIIEDLRDRGHRYLQLANVSERRIDEVTAEHRELLAAVRNSDEKAALAVLRVHLEHTRRILQQQFWEREKDEIPLASKER